MVGKVVGRGRPSPGLFAGGDIPCGGHVIPPREETPLMVGDGVLALTTADMTEELELLLSGAGSPIEVERFSRQRSASVLGDRRKQLVSRVDYLKGPGSEGADRSLEHHAGSQIDAGIERRPSQTPTTRSVPS